ADIGISLPGTGETPSAPVFIDGKKAVTLRGPNIQTEFRALVETYVARRYGAGAPEGAPLLFLPCDPAGLKGHDPHFPAGAGAAGAVAAAGWPPCVAARSSIFFCASF
ncbi:MAG: hypothetical protein B7Z45_09000, partial [Azorhizobium sp. 12-66-6]